MEHQQADHNVAQTQPLDYHAGAGVRTCRWQWDESTWCASLTGGDGERLTLRYRTRENIVVAEYDNDKWVLGTKGAQRHIHKEGEELPVATIRRRWLRPNEVHFPDRRVIQIDHGTSFSVTPGDQVRLTQGGNPLVVITSAFWSLTGHRLRISTSQAGAAFHGRRLLEVLGFYEIVEIARSD